jgi:hypothetical protein
MIFVGVAIYMVMTISVGLYASKKSHSVTDFMAAGLAGWLTTLAVAPELAADFINPPRPLCDSDSDGNAIDLSNRLGKRPLFGKS